MTISESPFTIKVTAAPDPSKVLVSGDGINNGLLATYQSSFNVDTRGAGPGQLTVKVRGPKGKSVGFGCYNLFLLKQVALYTLKKFRCLWAFSPP